MAVVYAAACTRCRAIAVDTLWSDHRVPIYACGSTPYELVCEVPTIAEHEVVDLTVPTDAELAELGQLMGTLAVAWSPVPLSTGRIGYCEVMHCDNAAIDGRCLDHATPTRAE